MLHITNHQETTGQYHLSTNGWQQSINKTENTSVAEGVEKLESFCLVDGNVKYYSMVRGMERAVAHCLPSLPEALVQASLLLPEREKLEWKFRK